METDLLKEMAEWKLPEDIFEWFNSIRRLVSPAPGLN